MIQLPGGYAMTADETCYMVGVPYKRKKDGREDLTKKLYYTSLSSAMSGTLQRIIRERVAAGDITEMRQLVAEVEKLRVELDTLLRSLE